MVAIEAPSHRYRFEADIGLGNDVRVSNGRFVWFYRPKQKSYTQTLADPAKDAGPDTSRSLWPDEGGIVGASQLRELAQFVADYKSAVRLSDANVTLRGHWFECFVVELSKDDLRRRNLIRSRRRCGSRRREGIIQDSKDCRKPHQHVAWQTSGARHFSRYAGHYLSPDYAE
jgi:hypothetical protein